MKHKPPQISDQKLQIIYDHYKDTFAHIRDYQKLRDRLFFFILIVIILMSFQIFSPTEASEIISQVINTKLGLSSPINFSFITSIIWFCLLALTIRYFQTLIYIERQYKHIHSVEKQLYILFNKRIFKREGKNYLSGYPLFLNFAWISYTIIFPVLQLGISWVKIKYEWSQPLTENLLTLINTGFFVLIGFSILTGLSYIHFKK
jgi:hypothetical protein